MRAERSRPVHSRMTGEKNRAKKKKKALQVSIFIFIMVGTTILESTGNSYQSLLVLSKNDFDLSDPSVL